MRTFDSPTRMVAAVAIRRMPVMKAACGSRILASPVIGQRESTALPKSRPDRSESMAG